MFTDLDSKQLIILRNALSDFAIALRTNFDGVVMSEKTFLASDFSEGRYVNYETAMEMRDAAVEILLRKRF